MKAKIFLIVLGLAFGIADAADLQNTCNAILSNGVRDNFYVYSSRQQFELYQKRLCDARFSSYSDFQSGSSSLGIDVPFGDIVLGLSGSTESKSERFGQNYQKYCEATYSSFEYRDKFEQSSATVNQSLVKSWAACQKDYMDGYIAANNKGIYISVSPRSDLTGFVVKVNRRNPIATTPIEVTSLFPSSLQCNRNGQSFGPNSKVSQNEFQFECSKPASLAMNVSIDTRDGPSNEVTVPSENPKFNEITDRLYDQNAKMGALEQRLSTRISNIAAGKNCTSTSPIMKSSNSWQTLSCPLGQYVHAVSFQHANGQDFTYQEQVVLECCPLQ
jgi:hypothetical protein